MTDTRDGREPQAQLEKRRELEREGTEACDGAEEPEPTETDPEGDPFTGGSLTAGTNRHVRVNRIGDRSRAP